MFLLNFKSLSLKDADGKFDPIVPFGPTTNSLVLEAPDDPESLILPWTSNPFVAKKVPVSAFIICSPWSNVKYSPEFTPPKYNKPSSAATDPLKTIL